jgi:hypothetical protein
LQIVRPRRASTVGARPLNASVRCPLRTGRNNGRTAHADWTDTFALHERERVRCGASLHCRSSSSTDVPVPYAGACSILCRGHNNVWVRLVCGPHYRLPGLWSPLARTRARLEAYGKLGSLAYYLRGMPTMRRDRRGPRSRAGRASNNAFERSVMPRRVRAASARVYCAPAARSHAHRAAAQRER